MRPAPLQGSFSHAFSPTASIGSVRQSPASPLAFSLGTPGLSVQQSEAHLQADLGDRGSETEKESNKRFSICGHVVHITIVRSYTPLPTIDWAQKRFDTFYGLYYADPDVADEFRIFFFRTASSLAMGTIYIGGQVLVGSIPFMTRRFFLPWVLMATTLTSLMAVDAFLHLFAEMTSSVARIRMAIAFASAFIVLVSLDLFMFPYMTQCTDGLQLPGFAGRTTWSETEQNNLCVRVVEGYHISGILYGSVGAVMFPLPHFLLAIMHVVLCVFAAREVSPVHEPAGELAIKILITVITTIGAIALTYLRYTSARTAFEGTIVVETQRREASQRASELQNLLTTIVPSAVLPRLMAGGPGQLAVDHVPSASMLFADMKGFTAWSSSRPASSVAAMLNTIVATLDRLVSAMDAVEKVKTIGDAYWAVAGIPVVAEDHADQLVLFAWRMNAAVLRLSSQHPEWGDVLWRIAVHSGTLAGALFGRQQVSYEVFGETSDITQVVEANGVPGAVCVTMETLTALLVRPHGKYVRPHMTLDGRGVQGGNLHLIELSPPLEGSPATSDLTPFYQADAQLSSLPSPHPSLPNSGRARSSSFGFSTTTPRFEAAQFADSTHMCPSPASPSRELESIRSGAVSSTFQVCQTFEPRQQSSREFVQSLMNSAGSGGVSSTSAGRARRVSQIVASNPAVVAPPPARGPVGWRAMRQAVRLVAAGPSTEGSNSVPSQHMSSRREDSGSDAGNRGGSMGLAHRRPTATEEQLQELAWDHSRATLDDARHETESAGECFDEAAVAALGRKTRWYLPYFESEDMERCFRRDVETSRRPAVLAGVSIITAVHITVMCSQAAQEGRCLSPLGLSIQSIAFIPFVAAFALALYTKGPLRYATAATIGGSSIGLIGTALTSREGCVVGYDTQFISFTVLGSTALSVGPVSWPVLIPGVWLFIIVPCAVLSLFFSPIATTAALLAPLGGLIANVLAVSEEALLRRRAVEDELSRRGEEELRLLRAERGLVLERLVPRHVLSDLVTWFGTGMDPKQSIARSYDRVVIAFLRLRPDCLDDLPHLHASVDTELGNCVAAVCSNPTPTCVVDDEPQPLFQQFELPRQRSHSIETGESKYLVDPPANASVPSMLDKIKTVGDVVMLAGPFVTFDGQSTAGDPPHDISPEIVASFDAVAMLVHRVSRKCSLKAGVHIGSVVGTVQGSSRLAFDIFGDAVNVASRVMAHTPDGVVMQASSAVHGVVARNASPLVEFGSSSSVTAKGKGKVTVFPVSFTSA